jgi:branched-chain amino acid transport system permease protein
VLSGFITGVGGALYAHYLTGFQPSSFYVAGIVGILTMAIIGGLGSISGALTGAVLISVVNELLRRLENGVTIGPLHIPAAVGISQGMLGVILILVLRWRPSGLLGALEVEIDPRLAGKPRAIGSDGVDGRQPTRSEIAGASSAADVEAAKD